MKLMQKSFETRRTYRLMADTDNIQRITRMMSVMKKEAQRALWQKRGMVELNIF